jgi:hypothetical protein
VEQRRSLEEIVLEVTGSGSDQFGGPTHAAAAPPAAPGDEEAS